MTRREAVRNILLLSTSAAFLPACNFEEGPVYANVPLERGQRTFIELVTNAILPREGTEVMTLESTTDFILTMLNDCTSPEDIQKYLLGIKEFQQGVKSMYDTAFKRLDAEQQVDLFTTLGGAESMTEAAKHFFNKTNGLTRWHFTGSEYFMKEVQEFEFVPGRYIGCRAV
ncbi:MAG: gluconate 2-dehydrogenase subunit 3 family protein [Bacteroidota bacterium]